MTYSEFKKIYSWMVKKYPETSNFYRDDMRAERIATVVICRYVKRGSRWIETERQREEVTPEYYCNTVDAVPFFRNLGGREQVTMSYTKYGYIPFEISSISPDKSEKVVRSFQF